MTYPRPLRAIHWGIALLVTCQLALAVVLTQLRSLLEDVESEQARQALENSHIAIVGYYSDVMRLCAEQKASEAIALLQKNVAPERAGIFGFGDVWTWTAIDAETKLVPSWLVAASDGGCAKAFVQDLASRLASRRTTLFLRCLDVSNRRSWTGCSGH